MEKIKITPVERKMLRRYIKSLTDQTPFEPDLIMADWQEVWKSLMDKADKFMKDNGLEDEMLDYTPDSNLLVWLDYRLALQALDKEAFKRIEESCFKVNEFSPAELRALMREVRADRKGLIYLDGILWFKRMPFKEQIRHMSMKSPDPFKEQA